MKIILTALLALTPIAKANVKHPGLGAGSEKPRSAVEHVTLRKNNHILLTGPIEYGNTSVAAAKLHKLNLLRANRWQPLYLVIDSPGGSIEAGLLFIQAVRHIPNLKTITIFGASMGAMIAQSLPGERLVMEDSQFMFHRASVSGLSGQFNEGELEARVAMFKRRVERIERKVAKRVSLSLEQYRTKVKDEWWIEGEDAVDQKAADKIVEVSCHSELLKKPTIVVVMSMFFGGEFKMSECPLIVAPIGDAIDSKENK